MGSSSQSYHVCDGTLDTEITLVDSMSIFSCDVLINDSNNLSNREDLSIYKRSVIMNDSGANVVMIRDEELMDKKRMTRCMKWLKVRGVKDAQFICEATGYLVHPFDKLVGMYVPSFKANILGEIAVRKAGYGVVQNNVDMVETDNLKYMDDRDNEVAIFKRGKEQLWCYEITKDICLVSVQSSNGDRDIELPGQNDKNLKGIIDGLMKKGYSMTLISQFFRVHDLHKKLNYASCAKMQRMVAHNLIKNLDRVVGSITEKAILAYFKDLHDELCPGCTGKVVAERSPPLDSVYGVYEAVKAHGDFFYITAHRLGVPNLKGNFLFFVDEKTRLFMVFPILNDKEEEVKKVMMSLLNLYQKYNKQLKVIRFDNAKLFQQNSKFNEFLVSVGITVEPCDPERHVRLVESATGYLKRTFKCICAGLTYKYYHQSSISLRCLMRQQR